jgi:hypothetical protein
VDNPSGNGAATPAQSRTSGLATSSIVLGIAGLFILPLVAPILAIVFGSKARKEIAADPSIGGAGLARAGVILGWVGLALTVVVLLWFVAFTGGGGS